MGKMGKVVGKSSALPNGSERAYEQYQAAVAAVAALEAEEERAKVNTKLIQARRRLIAERHAYEQARVDAQVEAIKARNRALADEHNRLEGERRAKQARDWAQSAPLRRVLFVGWGNDLVSLIQKAAKSETELELLESIRLAIILLGKVKNNCAFNGDVCREFFSPVLGLSPRAE